jgi:glycosyltransferase involved in cell wall biosynthesis
MRLKTAHSSFNSAKQRRLRLLTLLEADSLTGPAKAFVEFCAAAPVDAWVVSFRRTRDPMPDREPYAALRNTLSAVGARYELTPEDFRLDLRVISHLREKVQRIQPDIIESHSVKSHAAVWFSRLWKRVPWVAYHHGYTEPDLKMRIYNCADTVTLRNADRVVTVAQAFAHALLRRGVKPERLCVVQNALGSVTTPVGWQRSEARKFLRLPEATPVVLCVGRLSAEKGVADLLRAFGLLAKDASRLYTLLIVGDGPERERLEILARELGILELTRFTGHVTDPSPFYAAADVLAIPSLSEGSPFTLLEAFAAGLPVVATAVGGIPDMVSDGISAMLVPPRKPDAMAARLRYLLHDPYLRSRLVGGAKQKIAGEFAPGIRANRLMQLFSEAIAAREEVP